MENGRVPGCGSLSAKLAIVGEAPGELEVRHGEPFIGPAGWRLKEWMTAAGLSRSQCYILNVVEYRPPQNKIALLLREDIEQWMRYLHERLAALEDPWLIVPTGNYALYALTGKGKVAWHQRDGVHARPGILDWRGSILEYRDLRGRCIKLIPTIHPSATFRQPSLERVCRRDWERVKAELEFRECRLPVHEHFIRPRLTDLEAYYHDVTQEEGSVLAIDIENPKRQVSKEVNGKKKKVWTDPAIVCVGFSADPLFSITVPTTERYWGSKERLNEAWGWIKRLCESRCDKALHNGLYDTYHLAAMGILLAGWKWDTLYMHHFLDPSDQHALDYCASVDSREPFWKFQSKDVDQASRFTSNWAAFLDYNGKDCCVTRELYDVYHLRLSDRSLVEKYLAYYAALFEPLLAIMRHGFNVDDTRRRQRLAYLLARCIQIQDSLEALTGEKLYGKKSLSTKKLQHYLYDILKLPKQFAKRTTGEKTESANEVAVRKLMIQYPQQLTEVGGLILDHRRQAQLATFYRTERIDPDGRFRSSYSLNTEAGRLSSSANPSGTGSNAQNVDREARDIFLADEGCIGLEVDLSAAESRINYLALYSITGDVAMLEKSRARPDEYDQHTENAAYIFNIDQSKVTYDQRYIGKKAVHGAFRGLRGHKLADELLKDGYVYTPAECDAMIEAFIRRAPGILDYFREVRGEIISNRVLENSWGYRLYFTYDRLDEETYRRGYSFEPQSEVAFLMNQYGLVELHRLIQRNKEFAGVRINTHTHDSLFISTPPKVAWDIAEYLVYCLEKPRMYRGIELSIPTEIKVGKSWATSHSWKRLPSQQEFESVVYSLPT